MPTKVLCKPTPRDPRDAKLQQVTRVAAETKERLPRRTIPAKKSVVKIKSIEVAINYAQRLKQEVRGPQV